MDIVRKINEIESKIKRVAPERDGFQDRNFVLLDENKQLKEELSKQSETIRELQKRLVNTQKILIEKSGEIYSRLEGKPSKKKSLSGTDTEALKKQIDQYVQEIDKCIEWLQNS